MTAALAIETSTDALVHPDMIVAGRPTPAKNGIRYRVFNPANQLCVGTAPLGSAEDAQCAVSSAAAALPAWKATSVAHRAAVVARGLCCVSEHATELARLLTCEQGKPLAESLAEINDFIAKMRTFIRLANATTDGRIRLLPSMRGQSYGNLAQPSETVTVSLIAWNFPVALLGKKAGPALLAGSTVIVKPAYTTPLTTLRIVALMNAAGLPPGVLNCVTGEGKVIGVALVGDPEVGHVHVTGSDDTGKEISDQKRSTSTELSLDLAASDPMIVCDDADLTRALKAALIGRYRNGGQACTAVKRLYVAAEVYDYFVDQLVQRVRLFEPGDGLTAAVSPATRIGPLHTAEQCDRLEAQLDDALRKGARVLAGGYRPKVQDCAGNFFVPTIVADASATCKLVTEEVFGPILPVFRTRSFADAIDQANDSPWELNASVWTSSQARAREAKQRVRCRRLWVNRLSFGIDLATAPAV
jgi:succinate-semialdehyde dehydrogenase/glutarate-semialdehyde dehydrogenase